MNQKKVTYLLLILAVCLIAALFFVQTGKAPTGRDPALENPEVSKVLPQESDLVESDQANPSENADGRKQAAEPNVLLIILDDIGLDYFPGYLSGQGFEKATMPTMTDMMNKGFVFEGLHTYSMCSPTRASLLTGVHGVDTGVLDAGRTSYLDPKWQSVQQEIKSVSDNSITTAVFGKWHLLGSNRTYYTHPNEFGIDHYEGIIEGNHESYSDWNKTVNGVQEASGVYSTTAFTDAAIDWIDQQEGQWFTWLAYTAPHTPFHLPPADLHTIDGLSGDERDLRRNKDKYFMAMLESVDTEIGRLLQSFDEETRNNTYVIVIGDNGTGGVSQEPFKSVGVKGSLHVGGVNTPMVVYSPYHNGGGVVYDQLISTIDFYPTILDMLELQQKTERSGKTFYPLVSGEANLHIKQEHVFVQDTESVAVRSETHKLIRNLQTNDEFLYNITQDFYEQNNLLNTNLDQKEKVQHDSLSNQLDLFLQSNY